MNTFPENGKQAPKGPHPDTPPDSRPPKAETTPREGIYIPHNPGKDSPPTEGKPAATVPVSPMGTEEMSDRPEELRPVEELEFHDFPETVCDKDDRQMVNGCNRPFRWICFLIITFRTTDERLFKVRGTGFLAGPRLLLTAGHCVFSRNPRVKGGWAEQIEVIPCAQEGQPYGSKFASTMNLRALREWTDMGMKSKDIGAILLPNAFAGLGHFGVSALSDTMLNNQFVVVTGYPGDKEMRQMWTVSGPVEKVAEHQLFYMNDTEVGQSGSPVFRMNRDTGEAYAVAVHAYGGCPNSGSRIIPRIGKVIAKWERESRGEGGSLGPF